MAINPKYIIFLFRLYKSFLKLPNPHLENRQMDASTISDW